MSTALRKLIQSVLPNFSSRELRSMVPWFDAVSGALDASPLVIAAAHVSGGAFERNYGFAGVTNPSTGNYVLTFAAQQTPNDLILLANVTSQGTPAGAINAYPNLQDPTSMVVNIWQILQGTAVRSQVSADFFVMVTRLPA